MAESVEQQSTTSLPWWVRVCHAGWIAVCYFWVTLLLGLVLPKALDLLGSDKPLQSLPYLWPILKAIIDHPIWIVLFFLGTTYPHRTRSQEYVEATALSIRADTLAVVTRSRPGGIGTSREASSGSECIKPLPASAQSIRTASSSHAYHPSV
jgi:hypothetical protein